MRVAIRADASLPMGTGHLRRCIELAREVAGRGADIVFVVRDLDGFGGTIAADAGFRVAVLPAPDAAFTPDTDAPPHADWAGVPWSTDAAQTLAALGEWRPDVVVVDHYAFDRHWHARVRDATDARLVAIDDLGDRPLDVAVILDQNYAPDHAAKHHLSAPFAPHILGGPSFALLAPDYRGRPAFAVLETVGSVGIFMGGTDLVNATAHAWAAVRQALGDRVGVELVATSVNPHRAELQRIAAADPHCTLTIDLPNLSRFFAAHDLQIGAGGGATWERCAVGVPTIAIAFADNHRALLEPLDTTGVLAFSAEGGASRDALAADIAGLAGDPIRRAAMARTAQAFVDGEGAARVAVVLDVLA